jgi:hypothetical protein
VTAADGTQATYTVTVNTEPGITISGITIAGFSVLRFSGVPPSPVSPGAPITIVILGDVRPDSWFIDISGPASSAFFSADFIMPPIPGFYNINVIAKIGGVDYSGSFGLIVD